jgi:hypothetical protein
LRRCAIRASSTLDRTRPRVAEFAPIGSRAGYGQTFNTSVPLASLTPAASGLSRSLADKLPSRSAGVEARNGQLPKLTVLA